MLNPVFSPKHMRHMIPMFYEVARLVCLALHVHAQRKCSRPIISSVKQSSLVSRVALRSWT